MSGVDVVVAALSELRACIFWCEATQQWRMADRDKVRPVLDKVDAALARVGGAA